MGKPYYLIDFENVQPKSLGRLQPGSACVRIFYGENQTKVALDVARTLQPFGADGDYVPITGSGPNAVDFHIAFYIGHIAAREPGASFVIVSKDTGFDPLIRHLKGKGIACRRIADIPAPANTAPAIKAPPVAKKSKAVTVVVLPEPNAAPGPKPAASASTHATKVVRFLKGTTRPTTESALKAFIRSHLQPAKLDDAAVSAVIKSLQSNRKLAIAGTKVTYTLD